jgi:hypothetical protein
MTPPHPKHNIAYLDKHHDCRLKVGFQLIGLQGTQHQEIRYN